MLNRILRIPSLLLECYWVKIQTLTTQRIAKKNVDKATFFNSGSRSAGDVVFLTLNRCINNGMKARRGRKFIYKNGELGLLPAATSNLLISTSITKLFPEITNAFKAL